MDIAKRIMQLCEKRNISIYRLADLSCLTQSTVQNIVSGRNETTTISTLEKICNGLDMTLAEFFNEEKYADLSPEARKELKLCEEFIRYKYSIKDKPGS